MSRHKHAVKTSYDLIAEQYATQFIDEMSKKPFDRKMLDLLIDRSGKAAPICDLGCGPGQIARYLAEQGANACGVDLSAEMVKHAQRLNPAIPFQQADMSTLDNIEDNAWAGIAAFYSIIHISRDQVVASLTAMRRVLRQNGWLLLTFHIGNEIVHVDEMLEQPVDLDFICFEIDEMLDYLTTAGFEISDTIERRPNTAVEVDTRRAYIFATPLK